MSKKSDLVVKSNRLVEASYRLTLVEQQIILYAICKSRESGKGLSAIDPVLIVATEFRDMFGSGEKSVYEQLKVALNTLYHRTLKIKEKVENKLEIKQSRWISMQSYIDQDSVLKLIFAPEILPFIKDLDKEFTPYRLEQIGRMSSTHAIRLYELLRQHLHIGKRTLEIVDLKHMLQIENEYPEYYNLKRRVVDVAKKQINDFSDIKVNYTQEKEGRKVTALNFKIEKNEMNKTEEKTKKKIVKKENNVLEENKKEEKSENKTYEDFHAEIIDRERKLREKKG